MRKYKKNKKKQKKTIKVTYFSLKTLNRFRFVGIWDPKIRKAGKQLPNVRLIRNVIVTDGNYPAVDMTHMFMQWGQFVDHDMVQVPQFRTGKQTPN
jgi:hypothetical protein